MAYEDRLTAYYVVSHLISRLSYLDLLRNKDIRIKFFMTQIVFVDMRPSACVMQPIRFLSACLSWSRCPHGVAWDAPRTQHRKDLVKLCWGVSVGAGGRSHAIGEVTWAVPLRRGGSTSGGDEREASLKKVPWLRAFTRTHLAVRSLFFTECCLRYVTKNVGLPTITLDLL